MKTRSQLFEAEYKIEALKRKLKSTQDDNKNYSDSCQRYEKLVESLRDELETQVKKGEEEMKKSDAKISDLQEEVRQLKKFLKQNMNGAEAALMDLQATQLDSYH